jgi:hypothetical protein
MHMDTGPNMIVGCNLEQCVETSTGRNLLEDMLSETGMTTLSAAQQEHLATTFQMKIFPAQHVREDNLVVDSYFLGLEIDADAVGKDREGGSELSLSVPKKELMELVRTARLRLSHRGYEGQVQLILLPIDGGKNTAELFIGWNVMRTLTDMGNGVKTLYRALRDSDLGGFDGNQLRVWNTRFVLFTTADGDPLTGGIEMYLGLRVSSRGFLSSVGRSSSGPSALPLSVDVDELRGMIEEVSRLSTSWGVDRPPTFEIIPGENYLKDPPPFHAPATLDLLQKRIRNAHGPFGTGTRSSERQDDRETYIPPVQPEIIYQPSVGSGQTGSGSNQYGSGSYGGGFGSQAYQQPVQDRGIFTYTSSSSGGPAAGFSRFAYASNESGMSKNFWPLFIAGVFVNMFFIDPDAFPEPLDIFIGTIGFMIPFIIFYIYARSQIAARSRSGYGSAGLLPVSLQHHAETFWMFSLTVLFLMYDGIRLLLWVLDMTSLTIIVWIGLILVWFKYLGNRAMVFYYKQWVAK